MAGAESISKNDIEIEDPISKRRIQIAAKKISQKYKKMRSKKPSVPFSLTKIVEDDSVLYNNDTNLQDVASKKGVCIDAKKNKPKVQTDEK